MKYEKPNIELVLLDDIIVTSDSYIYTDGVPGSGTDEGESKGF